MEVLKLPPIFQSHMIIQRDKPIHVWGEGPEDARITVSFSHHIGTAIVKNHTWSCTLCSCPAGRNYTMTVTMDIPYTTPITLTDISVGDVWLAGGQSNMEYFLRYDAHWEMIKRLPKNPDIRMYNVPRLAFEGHKKDISDSGYWFGEQEDAWETFSAPGYCFARSLQPHLDVPIGIIGCNWGGTPACAWIDESYLNTSPLDIFLQEYQDAIRGKSPEDLRAQAMKGYAFDDSPKHQEEWKTVMYGISREEQIEWMKNHKDDPIIPMGPQHKDRPFGLYNQMLKTLAPFSLKGVLWYQGESDSGHGDIYDKTMEALITCWRKLWQDDFPFLFVQLAPFGEWFDIIGKDYPAVRLSQETVSQTIPNTYMTSIMDLGMYYDIHPKHKKEVGERLALLARGCVYHEDILCLPPQLKKGEVQGNKVILTFSNVGSGLYLKGEDLKDLLVLQEDHPLTPISIALEGDKIIISFKDIITSSIQVEYANVGYTKVNVYNSADLPLKPFIWKFIQPKQV